MQQKNRVHHFLSSHFPASGAVRRCAALLVAAVVSGFAIWLTSGCEEKKDWSEYPGQATVATTRDDLNIVGTWSLTGAGHTWYIHFAADRNWKITDDAAGHVRRVYGTYTLKGSSLRGPMNNPGTGTGEIAASFSGNRIDLDFIEHWHTPHKQVKYSGRKL